MLVNGIVQGVGFRPFIYRLARRHGLTGEVANTSTGVVIDVEGPVDRLNAFQDDISASPPPLAHVIEVVSRPAAPRACAEFRIVHSRADAAMATLISPDVGRLRGLPARAVRPRRPPLPLPVHQLHQLRPALHDHRGHPLRPPEHHHAALHHVPRLPGGVRRPARPPLPRPAQRLPGLRPAGSPVGCGALRDRARQTPSRPRPTGCAKGTIVAVKGLGGFHLACRRAPARPPSRGCAAASAASDKPFAVMVPRPGCRPGTTAWVDAGGRDAAHVVQRPDRAAAQADPRRPWPRRSPRATAFWA